MRSLFAATALAFVLALAPADARPRHSAHHAGSRPAACAGIPWCGCWLRLHLGIGDARLNRAIAWARIGSDAGGPGAGVIAVWRHHVGIITENIGGGMIRLLSGNDGRAVRDRVRSTRGIVAYRRI